MKDQMEYQKREADILLVQRRSEKEGGRRPGDDNGDGLMSVATTVLGRDCDD